MRLKVFILSLFILSAFLFINYEKRAWATDTYFIAMDWDQKIRKNGYGVREDGYGFYFKGEHVPASSASDIQEGMTYKTIIVPPFRQPSKTMPMFHITQHLTSSLGHNFVDGYWTLEPDYRFVDLWHTETKTHYAAVEKKEPAKIPLIPPASYHSPDCSSDSSSDCYPGFSDVYYYRIGKLPSFLTTKEPQEGQSWDYSVEDWSYNPRQTKPTDFSGYPPAFRRLLTAIIDEISSEIQDESTAIFESLDSAVGQLRTKADNNAKNINVFSSRIGQLGSRVEQVESSWRDGLSEVGGKISTLETISKTSLDNIEAHAAKLSILEEIDPLAIKDSGEVLVLDFVLDDKTKKKYEYNFPVGKVIDSAVFYIADDMRGSINVHIRYRPKENQYTIWYFKNAFNKLKKHYEDFNEADCFVRWQTYEY